LLYDDWVLKVLRIQAIILAYAAVENDVNRPSLSLSF